MWLGGAVAVAGVVALGIVLIPTHGSSTTSAQSPPTASSFTTPAPSGSERATPAPVAAVRGLDDEFVNDIVQRRNLGRAHSLLGAKLRDRYTLADWRAGGHLPISVRRGVTYRPASNIVSFYGPTQMGFVSTVSPRSAPATGEPPLFAVRFAKTNKRWLVDYIDQGSASRIVDQANYAPPGFLPGTHRQTFSDWAILELIGLALIAVVVFLDRLLSRPPKTTTV